MACAVGDGTVIYAIRRSWLFLCLSFWIFNTLNIFETDFLLSAVKHFHGRCVQRRETGLKHSM